VPARGSFLLVAALLTILVVYFAHRSAATLDQFANATTVSERDALPETKRESNVRADRLTVPESEPHDGQTGEAVADSRETETPPVTEEITLTTGVMFANVVVTQGAVVVSLAVAAWYFSIPGDAFGLAPDIWSNMRAVATETVGLGVGFGLVLWVGSELSTRVADAVGATYDESVRTLLAPESPLEWVGLLGVVLPVIAVSEELLFRGALIGVAATGTGLSPWLCSVGSSIAFALGHGAQGRVGVVVTGTLGFVLAAGYVLSASLLLVVVAHYVINAMEFLVHETELTTRLSRVTSLANRLDD
jgi:membrane protease YdiL (CAAX protease family)